MAGTNLSVVVAENDKKDVGVFNFENSSVRVVEDEHGIPLFVGKDICDLLMYQNHNDAINQHCKGAPKHMPFKTSGGSQQLRVLTEPDVFRLIVNSTLPSASKVEAWVFEEVLPSIRKTGSYALGSVAQLEVKQLEAKKLDLKDEIAKYDHEACKLYQRVDKFREEYGVRGKDAEAAIIELTDLNEALRDRVAELTEENLSLLFKKDELEHRVQYYQYNNGYGPLTKGQLVEGTNRANSKAMRSAGAHAFKMAKLHLDQLRDMLASFGYPLQHPGVMMVDAALYEMRNFSAWSGPRL